MNVLNRSQNVLVQRDVNATQVNGDQVHYHGGVTNITGGHAQAVPLKGALLYLYSHTFDGREPTTRERTSP